MLKSKPCLCFAYYLILIVTCKCIKIIDIIVKLKSLKKQYLFISVKSVLPSLKLQRKVKMEMYIWNISSGIFTLIVGVIVLTVFVKLIRRSKNSSQLFMPSDSLKESGKCDFPDCIRCRRQKEMLLRARTRLTYYSCEPTSTSRCQGYSELELLQKDIQSSYNNLNAVTYLENSLDAESPNPVVFVYKGIESKPVWSVNCFPGLNLLIENFEEIMQEFVSLFALLTEQNSKDANIEMLWKINDTPVGKWMICHLLDQGTKTVAADRCAVKFKNNFTLRTVLKITCVNNQFLKSFTNVHLYSK